MNTFAMHDCHRVFMALQMVPHARYREGDQRKRRRMVVWERGVEYAAVHVFVVVPGALGTELPDAPVGAVFAVEEAEDLVEWVAVGRLREFVGRHGHGDDGGVIADIAEVETGFVVLDPWTWVRGVG